MSDEERREADRLAHAKAINACCETDIEDEGERMSFKIGFTRGYVAGRESMRAEIRAESALRQMDIKQCMRLDDELKAERERGLRLFHLLQSIKNRGESATSHSSYLDLIEITEWARKAVAEHEEASRG